MAIKKGSLNEKQIDGSLDKLFPETSADIVSVDNSQLSNISGTDVQSVLKEINDKSEVGKVSGVKGDEESEYRTGNVNITKSNIGLGNVDNTSDADKPVSNAVNNALSDKQDNKPNGTDTIFDSNNKIRTTYIPDSILGQLEYKGTFDASKSNTISELEKGWYYICSTTGTYNPDGTTGTLYEVGDWAVYNGIGWDKVDNTDAVTMVNNQIGNVQTYKGEWVSGTHYYKGDFLKNSGLFYLCISEIENSTTNPSSDVTHFAIMGAVSGVKGDNESTYRTGNVNITKDNIGLGNVDNTADIDKIVASAGKLSSSKTITIDGDISGNVSTDFSQNPTLTLTLPNITTAGTYSAISVNAKGQVTAGGQIVEVGTTGQTTPSESLAVGGIFFQQI